MKRCVLISITEEDEKNEEGKVEIKDAFFFKRLIPRLRSIADEACAKAKKDFQNQPTKRRSSV